MCMRRASELRIRQLERSLPLAACPTHQGVAGAECSAAPGRERSSYTAEHQVDPQEQPDYPEPRRGPVRQIITPRITSMIPPARAQPHAEPVAERGHDLEYSPDHQEACHEECQAGRAPRARRNRTPMTIDNRPESRCRKNPLQPGTERADGFGDASQEDQHADGQGRRQRGDHHRSQGDEAQDDKRDAQNTNQNQLPRRASTRDAAPRPGDVQRRYSSLRSSKERKGDIRRRPTG